MAEIIINMIVLQDERPIILTVEITRETQIKGHHIYKNTWTLSHENRRRQSAVPS